MTVASENNKRIAKNTIFLYVRMIFVMGVTLFTSRVVLDKLGVVDYGLYNSVSGVVAMLMFLNGTLSTGTSRFLTFELGRNDVPRLKATFSTTFYTHLILALLVALFMESVGLWFVYEKLIIPPERLSAALWAYHISIFTAVIAITQVPYTSVIIAHENMKVYAYLGVFEAVGKLVIVYLLIVSSADRLIFYASLVGLVQLLVAMFYRVYCIRHYGEVAHKDVLVEDLVFDLVDEADLDAERQRIRGVAVAAFLFVILRFRAEFMIEKIEFKVIGKVGDGRKILKDLGDPLSDKRIVAVLLDLYEVGNVDDFSDPAELPSFGFTVRLDG